MNFAMYCHGRRTDTGPSRGGGVRRSLAAIPLSSSLLSNLQVLMVLGHTRCGAVKAALSGEAPLLRTKSGPTARG